MNHKKTRLRWVRVLLAVLLVLHLGMIFHLSAETAPQSDQTSTSVIETILQRFMPSFSGLSADARIQRIQSLQKSVRTLAHLLEFIYLGVLVCALALTVTTRKRLLALCLPLCAGTALLDEAHQLLVPGRTFQWEDVAVDTVGAALGIAAAFLLWRLGVYVVSVRKQKKGTTQ